MATIVGLALLLLALPLVLSCAYLLLLTVLSGALPVPPPSFRRLRFDVVVPAHDEAPVIARTIASLRRIDWPADRFRIRVIADNCSDATAALARAAGAEVIERADRVRRGKGHALDFAFRRGAAIRWADAAVVIDADSEVSPNLLEAFAARIEAGADAVQAYHGVSNPMASWRTRLLAIAIGCFHRVRSRARERLGVSSGIRGNGWCVTYALLARVPHACFSLTEDLEYGIELGLAGVAVRYADEARADSEMVARRGAAARTQRQRWEDGRLLLVRTRTWPLLAAAWRRSSGVCLDLAADLLVLPLSYVVLNALAVLLLAATASRWQPGFEAGIACAIACLAALLAYVLRGWQLSGVGLAALSAFARVPGFLAWKLWIMMRPRRAGWVRTEREAAPPTTDGEPRPTRHASSPSAPPPA